MGRREIGPVGPDRTEKRLSATLPPAMLGVRKIVSMLVHREG